MVINPQQGFGCGSLGRVCGQHSEGLIFITAEQNTGDSTCLRSQHSGDGDTQVAWQDPVMQDGSVSEGLSSKPNDLGLISATRMVEIENYSCKLSPQPSHGCHGICMHILISK